MIFNNEEMHVEMTDAFRVVYYYIKHSSGPCMKSVCTTQ